MRKLLFVFLLITVGVTAAFLYSKLSGDEGFGPTAMLVIAMGTGASLFVLASLLLYNTRYRDIVTKIWLAGVTVVVSYVALDLIAGLILIQPLSPPFVPDDYRHHKLVPNSHARLEQRDFSYVQKINSLGLRGEEIEIEKSPDTYRILMLGDSFTMGKGVEDDETFAQLLQDSLNRRLALCEGKPVEILNAGVDGYSPILSYVQLTRELHVLQPDMVVLNLDMNDLMGEAYYRQLAIHGDDGEIIGVQKATDKPLMERFRSWSERNLYFTRLLLIYVNEIFDYNDARAVVTQANTEVLAHTLADDTVQREEQWLDLFDSITRIGNFADEQGAEFLLTTYPHAHQVNDFEGIPGRYGFVPEDAVVSDRSVDLIREYSENNGIQFVSMFPDFRAYEGEDKLYFDYDTHWTPAGTRVMAGGIERYMTEHYIDEWCR